MCPQIFCLHAATYGKYIAVRADYPPWFIGPEDPDSVMYDFAVVELESPVTVPGKILQRSPWCILCKYSHLTVTLGLNIQAQAQGLFQHI